MKLFKSVPSFVSNALRTLTGRARDTAVATLILKELTAILSEADASVVVRRGPLVFFRFPKVHSRIAYALVRSPLLTVPTDPTGVSRAIRLCGLAASWQREHGSPDHIWRIFTAPDGVGFPATAVEVTRFPAAIVPPDEAIDVCFGWRNARRRRYASYGGYDYTPLFPR